MSQVGSRAAPLTAAQFQRDFLDNLRSVRGVDLDAASLVDCYQALASALRRHLLPMALDTRRAQVDAQGKWVYYLSAEYLLGRQLASNLHAAGLTAVAEEALAGLGLSLAELQDVESEPGLGNGGLGRLAACFLDSAATIGLPMVGYGIRYEYGIFRQTFVDGWQVERADEWMLLGSPWELPHPELAVTVGFGGHVESRVDERGRFRVLWRPSRTVLGVPNYYLVPGYRSGTVNSLRLWSAQATEAFNLQIFNRGDFTSAVQDKVASETISKVLYPVDETPQGRQLRLQQQYFFVACSLRDILRRLPDDVALERLPERVVIQLNDTHPTVAIPELMRLLVDEYLLPWDSAWAITSRVFAYTCHTLMPEALEKWSLGLFEALLPRHLQIIYEINRRFLAEVADRFGDDGGRLARMSIIEEGPERMVRMAHLAAVGCFRINGVAPLQSALLRDQTLRDFSELWPEKFTNVTNGVTPRRFLQIANPRLSGLIDEAIGEGWRRDLEQLRLLEPHADDPEFRRRWRAIKRANKEALAGLIRERSGVEVSPDALFDVMVKRLHEYKRQLLKALHSIALYSRIKADPQGDHLPRVVYFGAKAAPGYRTAKLIIKLINSVAAVVNADVEVAGRLRVAFPPNFNVTLAELIYPAADLSEQISLAGKEASGTGNMKFALNGAVTIGTMDGANIDIRALVGAENFFLCGLSEAEVAAARAAGYQPRACYEASPELRQALGMVAAGAFSPGEAGLFRPIVDSLLERDDFLVLADYESYAAQQGAVELAFRDEERWARMSILNAARCGYFSSDRSVRDYASQIWGVAPVDVAAWGGRGPEAEARSAPAADGVLLGEEEWALLAEAPAAVSAIIASAADRGLIANVIEEGAASQAPAAAARRYAANPLIQAVLRRMRAEARSFRQSYRAGPRAASGGRRAGWLRPGRGPEQAMALCAQVADLLERRVEPALAEEYKEWLLALGEGVANATTEGGFLSVGGSAGGSREAALLHAVHGALRARDARGEG